MPNLKKLTLLHSNDLHGDFTAEQTDTTSTHTVIEEYLCRQELITAPKDPRWITVE